MRPWKMSLNWLLWWSHWQLTTLKQFYDCSFEFATLLRETTYKSDHSSKPFHYFNEKSSQSYLYMTFTHIQKCPFWCPCMYRLIIIHFVVYLPIKRHPHVGKLSLSGLQWCETLVWMGIRLEMLFKCLSCTYQAINALWVCVPVPWRHETRCQTQR